MKKLFFVFVFASIVAFPSLANAQTANGGLATAMFPCTCSTAFTWYWFTPLYIVSVMSAGALAVPHAVTYPYYSLHPGAWELGFYTPGAQSCWIYVGTGCAALPTLGTMTLFTGVSS